jgi:twinkle protein
MDCAVYQNDIQHIILDNLQFMMPRSASKNDFAKYDNQDLIIEKLRKFCTEKQVLFTYI